MGKPDHVGRPDWAGRPADPGARGRARAAAVQAENSSQSQALPQAEQDKARALAARFPADFEFDRYGALAIRGEVLAAGLSDTALAAVQRAGFRIVRRTALDDLGLSLVVLTHRDWPLDTMVDRLRRMAPDAVVEADHIFFASGAESVHTATPVPSARRAPTHSTPARSWRLGIIDTGASTAVAARSHVAVVRRGFAPGGFVPSDHGTAVAAIAALGEGQRRTRGTLFIADIFGAGPRGGSAEQMVSALAWMAQQRVPVTNISMVGPHNRIVATVIAALGRRGFLVVAPVGNDGAAARPLFPASLKQVVAVTAVDRQGAVLPEASRVSKVDFASPGIFSVRNASGRTVEVRGTSYASPVVARHLAELLPAPDAQGANAAVRQLAATAWKPKRASRRSPLGRGIVGLPPAEKR
jgi:hypothetical protein